MINSYLSAVCSAYTGCTSEFLNILWKPTPEPLSYSAITASTTQMAKRILEFQPTHCWKCTDSGGKTLITLGRLAWEVHQTDNFADLVHKTARATAVPSSPCCPINSTSLLARRDHQQKQRNISVILASLMRLPARVPISARFHHVCKVEMCLLRTGLRLPN